MALKITENIIIDDIDEVISRMQELIGPETDLFVGLADVFRAKAEEATPTDATPVTRDVTVYKELNDSDKDRNLAGAVIKVFKDSACTESITEFVLSYDGKAYGGDDRVVYKNLEERVNANASKAIAKLQEDTYYYQLDEKLFRSNDDYSKTGYDYNNTVGSFSIVAGDGVQEIKLDNNMFRPTEKVATPTDASSEVSTEVSTEATTESDTQVATTSDASSEETKATTQVATPTDSIPEVKPIATLASVFRMAKAAKAATTTAVSRGTGYGYNGGTISYIFYINKDLTYNNTGYAFCMEKGKTGPTSGTGTVSSIGKGNITKALYYSFAGPGAGSYDGAPSSGGLNGDNVMTLSCILDYYYTGYWDSGDFGTAYDNAISYEKWLKGKDMPNTLADTAFSIAGKSDDFTASRAAYNITDKTQTTNEWAVVSKKSVTVTIPTGVTMHKTDSKGKKSTHGAGTATVSNGDKIYFSASIAKGGTSDIKFTSVKGYSAYKADFGAELQVLGFLGEPTDKEFTAKLQWNSPNFSLRKTDSKTRQPVEGAEYLVYCAQDNEKVNVVRFKTNSNGVGEITSVNPTQASGEVGKTVVKLKAGVRYYIVETKMTSSAISTDTNTKMSVAGKNSSFKDSVKATNLKASTKYTLMSVAVDANTGKAYKDADGKYVAKNVEFTTGAVKKGTVFPETTASVTFTGVNTSNVKSRKLVFYEYLVEGSVTKTVSLDSAGKPVEPANCVAKDASVSNKAQTVNVISLETKVLVDSTKTNVAPADEKVDVTDTVTLHNLVAGTKFTLVGKVSDGENIKVENEVEFTAKGDDETVSVPLKGLNLTEYAGKSLYVICELKYDGEVIATHNEDGTDPDEKFYVPAVETNAIDATTNTQYSILDKTQIIDSVKYSNLPTEYEYELETTFVDSATGEEIKKTEIEKDPYWNMLKDLGYVTDETSSDSTGDSVAEDTGKIVSEVGKAFKRTQVLKPEKMDDTVNVTFDIDPRSFNLEGKTITIRQVIKLNGVAVAKHTDKDAESQQISFPTGSTLAVDNTSHNHTIAPTKDADVVDTIFCKNLATGISVDFYGIAIDKDTNKPVELNGKPVVVKQSETISKADQEVQLHYVVDGTKLKGKRLTSFVFAVYNGKIVFKHTDPNSAEQSFSFSSLRTKFLDDKNGTHATMLTEDVHQTDTVTLDGLTKGERFTLKGVVYNKSTRKPMLVDGKQVTNSIDFTAKGNSEEVALKYQYNGLKSDAYHKDKNDDLVSFVYLYKDGILIDKEEDFDSFDQTIKLPSCGTSASDGITKLHVGYASKTAIFRDSVDYYNLIVGDWYSTTLTLHLNKDGKDAGPLKDANGNLITATVKFQAKTTDGSVKVEVKYDASLLAGETITAFETIRTKGYEVCGHTEITDEGQQIHYPELKTSAKNSKDNSQHVKEGEVAKIVDTVNYSKLDSSVAYKVVTEAWDYNTQQIVVSDGKKVRKVTELHVDSKKSENGSFDVSMSFKTDGLGKHRIVIFEYVYDNKGNLISKEADFDAESQTIYIDKTPNKTGDRTVVFLSILAGMLGLGVVTLFVTRRKKK